MPAALRDRGARVGNLLVNAASQQSVVHLGLMQPSLDPA
jgi:hypothetical protein